MNTQEEKRKKNRSPFNYPVLLEMDNKVSDIASANFFQWPGNGVDISSTGIGILSRQVLTPGDKVKIHLYLGPKETILPAYSEVRWTQQADTYYRVGLQFLA
ncbi:MAG: PilZ domain-containing protein [Deltaproteobacteria bacterium]|nr:PilZ domain-containing protein [Deltaproteobacteria bacterium]